MNIEILVVNRKPLPTVLPNEELIKGPKIKEGLGKNILSIESDKSFSFSCFSVLSEPKKKTRKS